MEKLQVIFWLCLQGKKQRENFNEIVEGNFVTSGKWVFRLYFINSMAEPTGLALFLKNWSMDLGSGMWYGRPHWDSAENRGTHQRSSLSEAHKSHSTLTELGWIIRHNLSIMSASVCKCAIKCAIFVYLQIFLCLYLFNICSMKFSNFVSCVLLKCCT